MRTAIIRLRQDTRAAFAEIRQTFLRAWHSGNYQHEVFEFESPSALFKFLTPQRWELLDTIQHSGPVSLRQGRFDAGDIAALLDAGLLVKNDHEQVYVSFTAIHADFTLRKAA